MRKALLTFALALAALQLAMGLAGTIGAGFLGLARNCSGEAAIDAQGNVLYSRERCETTYSASLTFVGLGASVAAGGALAVAGLLSPRRRRAVRLSFVLGGAALGFPLLYGLYLLAVPFLVAVLGTAFLLSEEESAIGAALSNRS